MEIGDTVVRISGEHAGMQVGDTDVITGFDAHGVLLKKTGDWSHERRRLKVVARQPVGRKDDSGKLAMNLLDDMPNALAAVVEVMQWAVTDKKPVPYERGSWQGVHADRYREAIKRHDQASCAQAVEFLVPGQYRDAGLNEARFQRDHETNLLHLAHIATSALMALENTIRELKGKQ